MTWILTALAVAAYLVTGGCLALRSRARAWAVARREWSFSDESAAGSVKGQLISMFLFWPFYGTWICCSSLLGRVADAGDPKALAERVREQQARIAELERELGMR